MQQNNFCTSFLWIAYNQSTFQTLPSHLCLEITFVIQNKMKIYSQKRPNSRSEKVIFLYNLRLCAQRCPRVGPRGFPGTLKGSNLYPQGCKRTHIFTQKVPKGIQYRSKSRPQRYQFRALDTHDANKLFGAGACKTH